VCSIEKISEQYLIPALETMLDLFPFKVIRFHSGNGSEYRKSFDPDIIAIIKI
jgi:hypothetical protein